MPEYEFTEIPEETVNQGVVRRSFAWMGRLFRAGRGIGWAFQADNPPTIPPGGKYERDVVIIQLKHRDPSGPDKPNWRDGVALSTRAHGFGHRIRLWGQFLLAKLEGESTGPVVVLEGVISHRDGGRDDKKGFTMASPRDESHVAYMVKGKRDYGNFRYGFLAGSKSAQFPFAAENNRGEVVFWVDRDGRVSSPTLDAMYAEIVGLRDRVTELENE